MYINITQEDIELGVREDATSCPIARATMRSIENKLKERGFVEISVNVYSFGHIFLGKGNYWQGPQIVLFAKRNSNYKEDYRISIPIARRCEKFINDFDNGWEVKPMRIILNDKYLDLEHK
jgi:hypothetical protein